MALLSSLRGALGKAPAEEEGKTSVVVDVEGEKSAPAGDDGAAVNGHTVTPEEELQRGVQEVEAVTMTWSKLTLAAVFFKCVLTFPLEYNTG
jgi:hypothetical protein